MKIFFIVNKGRRQNGPGEELLNQFHTLLKQSGVEHEIQLCDSVDHTETCLVRALDRGFDTLWIGGGDGTINHALNFTFGKFAAYGIVPMGTVNALARALRMPLAPIEAVKYLLEAQPVPMDIGTVAGRYFFTYATVGMHAAVFHNIDPALKKRWGALAFWDSAWRTVRGKTKLPRFLLEMELADAPPGEHIERDYGYSFTLSNMANYAGFGTITKEDAASPGYFELHNFRRNRLMPMFIWFALLRLLGIEGSRPERGQIFRLIRWVNVRSNKKLSVQIDGEPIKPADPKNLRFECLPDAVNILLKDPERASLRGRREAEEAAAAGKWQGLTEYHEKLRELPGERDQGNGNVNSPAVSLYANAGVTPKG